MLLSIICLTRLELYEIEHTCGGINNSLMLHFLLHLVDISKDFFIKYVRCLHTDMMQY